MVRKASLGSTVSPAAVKAEPSIDLVVSITKRHYEEWKACKGCPATHKQKELAAAEENLKVLQSRALSIERTVQETQKQQAATQAELKRFEVMQEDIDAAVAKVGIFEGRHKSIKDQWYPPGPRKHVQVAWENNNRCSQAWQTAMSDRAEAQRIEADAKQKIEKILEERKQLEKFGVYVSALPAESDKA